LKIKFDFAARYIKAVDSEIEPDEVAEVEDCAYPDLEDMVAEDNSVDSTPYFDSKKNMVASAVVVGYNYSKACRVEDKVNSWWS